MRRIRLPSNISTLKFPLHYEGAPQRRLFFPEWYFTLVKPREPMPKNYVRFHIPADMTKYDVKEYLDKIYKISVINVRLGVVNGIKYKSKNPWREDSHMWKFMEPWKIAHVYLADGKIFEYPNPLKLDDTSENTDDRDLTILEKQEKMQTHIQQQKIKTDRDNVYFVNKWL